MVRCQRHVSETAERYCDRSPLPCLVTQRAPGSRTYSGDLAVSPARQTADSHYPVDTIGRVIGLSCRSTVNRDQFADSLLPIAYGADAADVGLRLRRTRTSEPQLPFEQRKHYGNSQTGTAIRTAVSAFADMEVATSVGRLQVTFLPFAHRYPRTSGLTVSEFVLPEEMWRGSRRFGLSVAAPFVWWCPSNFALTPFPHAQPMETSGES